MYIYYIYIYIYDMVGNINQEKNTTKIKALFAVHKHKKILHCDNHCP